MSINEWYLVSVTYGAHKLCALLQFCDGIYLMKEVINNEKFCKMNETLRMFNGI